MIIVDPVPGLDCVAQFASPARHQLYPPVLVRILVARLTSGRGECKTHHADALSGRRLVTGHTRNRQVGAAKRVIGLLMAEPRGLRRREPSDGMTFSQAPFEALCTNSHDDSPSDNRYRQRTSDLLGLPGAMALVALQGEMLTLKRVARLAVIEVYRIDDLPPSLE